MLYEGLFCHGDENDPKPCECASKVLTLGAIFIQGVATSIDALSVGLTISDLGFLHALLEAGIIAGLTFFICYAGILIGRKFGTKLERKASVLGGIVLIAIGFKIFFFG
jgi:putative Mn2+ efflux pump MntP